MTPQHSRYGDYLGAILLVGLGSTVSIVGAGYGVGTLTDMGPGFIPTALGILMAIVGALIGLTAETGTQNTDAPSEARRLMSLIDGRAWGCILGGVGAFIVLGARAGFVPATFASILISAMGDRRNSFRDAAFLAAGLVAAGYIIFIWGLKLQFEPFKWG